jgi:hypothetical protein
VDPALVGLGAVDAFGVTRVVYDLIGRWTRVRRALARMRRVRIGDAKGGVARVSGSVRAAGELLRAPVTHRACAAFQVVIEMRDGRWPWRTEMELADARPFFVADDSGEAVVDTGAGPFSLALIWDRRGSTHPWRSDDDPLRTARGLLESANVTTSTWTDRSKAVRYREAVLLVGATVSVGGRGAREVTPHGQRAGPREPPERFVLRGTAEEPLLISNWRDAFRGRRDG